MLVTEQMTDFSVRVGIGGQTSGVLNVKIFDPVAKLQPLGCLNKIISLGGDEKEQRS